MVGELTPCCGYLLDINTNSRSLKDFEEELYD